MKLIKIINKKNSIAIAILPICSLLAITGCQTNSYSMNDEDLSPKNKSIIYSNLIKKKEPTISVREYVSRVGKKVLLVSNDPERNIDFNVSNSSNGIDISGNTINISPDVLASLNDEASLAYVIAASIEKLNNYKSNNEFEEDKEVMQNLARAGYDPKAAVDVQTKYLDLPDENNYSWVKGLSTYRINSKRISKNKNYANSFSGLKRYKDRYINIVKPS